MQGYRNLVAVDPKHRLELPGALVVTGIAAFRQTWPQRATRVVFRPDLETDDTLRGEVDEALARVLHYGRTAVLVDEALDLATSTKIVPAYRRVIRLGRELVIPVFSCSQRPMGLHNDVLSQSEHLFVFDLPLRGDRDKVSEIGGPELLERADDRLGAEHGFAYYGPATRGRAIWIPPLHLPPAPAAPAPEPSRPLEGPGG